MNAALALSRDATEFFRLLDVRLEPWLAREADPDQAHDAGVITTINNLCGTELRYVWSSRGNVPFDDAYVQGLRAIAARHAHTSGIRDFLCHPAFPVDIRHNAKIGREKLAAWATSQLKR